ncbi:hypothetical protein IGB42_03438 [Andreprevotia sp. IGB-42]|uniref:hypothetical protein n=1 Tax=Andreprevotia sp. IGB-42 TaxID=2497473 RepID=UPI00135BD5DE|nr:hypothetical protein [Andreprevotia sp. IGB-42]KAF0812160.1 hypothetical protein IGB42_03438 [Andreprevotia sp. IGB-42]
MTRFFSLVGAGLLAGVAFTQAGVAQAQVRVSINVGVPVYAAPAPIVYAPPRRPGYLWVEPGWYGQGRARYWREGYWQPSGYRVIEYQPAPRWHGGDRGGDRDDHHGHHHHDWRDRDGRR